MHWVYIKVTPNKSRAQQKSQVQHVYINDDTFKHKGAMLTETGAAGLIIFFSII